MQPFQITIKRGYRTFRVMVTRTMADKTREQYTAQYGDRCIVVENNRPRWMALGVRHRMEWKLAAGQVAFESMWQKVCEQIEAHIKKVQQDEDRKK